MGLSMRETHPELGTRLFQEFLLIQVRSEESGGIGPAGLGEG